MGGTGVAVDKWEGYPKSWHKYYEKIVWRKLNCEKNAKLLNTLQDFMKETIGNKYELNVGKLTRQQSRIGNEDK